LNNSIRSKSRDVSGTARITKSLAGQEISKSAVMTMGVVSGIIGMWGLACFVGGMVTSGPIGLAKGWISAVTGM
jgi:hypothetical protein